MRSPSFRLAKDSVRFCWFWASSTPETKRRGEPYPSNEIFEMETEVATKLHESAANPLKSLVRVNLCAGGWVRRNLADHGPKDRFPLHHRVTTARPPIMSITSSNRSIALNCGEEDTSSLSGGIRDLDPVPDEDLNAQAPIPVRLDCGR